MSRFNELLTSHEDWLMKRLLYHAKRVIDIGDGASVEEAWRRCVRGLSGVLIKGLKTMYPDFEFRQGEDFRHDPLCAFMVNTAIRHRERGISLEMFHALMVYYKQAWLDLVNYAGFEAEYEAECLKYTARMFDRMMVAFCAEWVVTDQSRLIEELQVSNRSMSKEKDRYLTIFEGVPNPVFIIDEQNLIADLNLAASLMLDVSAIQGAQYYMKTVTLASDSRKEKDAADDNSKVLIGKPISEVFPWLAYDFDKFIAGSQSSVSIEKEIQNPEETRYFNVKLSRILDMREVFGGVIIILEDITAQKQAAEELAQANAKLSKALNALWGEMELAKKIQTCLLPEKTEISGYEITASTNPFEEVGGDYYDVISVRGFDWIVIGDVSGHGITSGLVMMMVQTSIHTVLINNPQTPPSRLLSVINRTIYENIEKMDESKHMTIVVIAYGQDGFFNFSGAHEDILLWRSDTGKVERIETDGVWIGLEADISKMLPMNDFRLETGDCMVLFTDGIIESQGRDGKMFETERLIKIIESYGGKSAYEIHSAILDALKNYEISDDVTLLVMKRV